MVFVPMFAEYPFNESRDAEKPFCLCCGRAAGAHEAVCPTCGVPLVKKRKRIEQRKNSSRILKTDFLHEDPFFILASAFFKMGFTNATFCVIIRLPH